MFLPSRHFVQIFEHNYCVSAILQYLRQLQLSPSCEILIIITLCLIHPIAALLMSIMLYFHRNQTLTKLRISLRKIDHFSYDLMTDLPTRKTVQQSRGPFYVNFISHRMSNIIEDLINSASSFHLLHNLMKVL